MYYNVTATVFFPRQVFRSLQHRHRHLVSKNEASVTEAVDGEGSVHVFNPLASKSAALPKTGNARVSREIRKNANPT